MPADPVEPVDFFLMPFDDKLATVDQTAPFFYHFGEFVWQFAVVERFVHFAFDKVCGLDHEVARQLIGGQILSNITSMLRVVVQVSKTMSAEQKEEVQDTIDQINTISKLRHSLVHRGAEAPAAHELRVSNLGMTRTKESIEILRLKLQNIKDATSDLRKITMRLNLVMQSTPEMRERILKGLTREIRDLLDAAWRYKQIEPDKPFQPSRKGSQSQQREQRSSRA